MSRIHAEDLRNLHQQIDELVKLEGVKGFNFSLIVYHVEGIHGVLYGRGEVIPEVSIRTELCMLADKCRKRGTANALAMLPAIEECIRHLDHLHDSNGEGTAPAQPAPEVMQ